MRVLPRPRPLALAVGTALALVLAGCNGEALARKMAPQEVQTASREAMGNLRARRFEALSRQLVASLRQRDLTADFQRMAAFIPPEEPLESHLAGYFFQGGTAGASYQLVYEFQYSHTWVVERLTWAREADGLRLADFHVNSQADSLEEIARFSLRAMTPAKWVVLIAGPGCALLSLYALVACIRTPRLRFKWLWILFILVGFGAFSVNWATGDARIGVLQLVVFSFSAFAPAGQPWTVTVAVPVGAVVFLDFLRKRKVSPAETPPSP